MRRVLYHLLCRREQVIVLRHFGHHSGRDALAAFQTVMQANPSAAAFAQLIDTRKWFGSIYDDDLAELAEWMRVFQQEQGLTEAPPTLAYLSRPESGADAIAPQVEKISGQQTRPFYDSVSAWNFLAPAQKMPWRVHMFLKLPFGLFGGEM